MGLKIKAIKRYPDYQLMLIFSDGSKRKLDGHKLFGLSDYFDELKDQKYFNKVKIAPLFHDTIEWPDGQDMSPEWLLKETVPVG